MRNQAMCKPQTKQQETLVHIISILNITGYTAQVNRQRLNEVIDALQRSNGDLNRLLNITEVLTQHIRYLQMYIYMCTILAYLGDSLTYMRQVAIHIMDYVDAATTNILSPDILPVEDLRSMLSHIESELSSTMCLPISSVDTLHFYYWYLNTHVLIAEGQFLLLIDVPIPNRAQQQQIYEVFNLPVSHTNLSTQYKINHRYIEVTYDETKAVAIMDQQYIACQHANGQFCRINAPFQSLTNPPSCITALYAKNDQAIREQCSLSISHAPCTFVPVAVTSNLWIIPPNPQILGSAITIIFPDTVTSILPLQQTFCILKLSPACSATSRYFHLPLHYEDHTRMINISLDTTNINGINISTLDFRIWQHFNSNWTSTHLHKLANVPEVPVVQLYKHMIDTSKSVHSFTIKDNDEDIQGHTHPGTYIGTIGMIFAACIGVYCFKRFWVRPATSRH